MADYIDREELLKELHRRHWEVMVDFIEMEFPVVKERIDDMPSVDAVEVVRCKDCKHRYKSSAYEHERCDRLIIPVLDDDFFCKWGEKRMNINDALAKEYNRGLADGKASVEQKHGQWIMCKRLGNLKPLFDTFRCSACDNLILSSKSNDYIYCPNCGAKMDEVTEDEH